MRPTARARRSTAAAALATCATLALALGGCVYAPPPPEPVPVVEVVPARPPGPVVWRRGHWRWNGVRYAWIPGHYAVRR